MEKIQCFLLGTRVVLAQQERFAQERFSGVMREKKPYQVLTFHTTDAAMEMESFCKQNGIAGRLVPVPRRLSAGCGIAWRMEAEVYAQYQTVIADCGIEIEQSEALVF